MKFLTWTVDHPWLFTLGLGVLYVAFLYVRALLSSELKKRGVRPLHAIYFHELGRLNNENCRNPHTGVLKILAQPLQIRAVVLAR